MSDTNIQIIFCQPFSASLYCYYINSLDKKNIISKDDLKTYLFEIVPTLYKQIYEMVRRFKEFIIVPESNHIEELIINKLGFEQEKKDILKAKFNQKLMKSDQKSEKETLEQVHQNLMDNFKFK